MIDQWQVEPVGGLVTSVLLAVGLLLMIGLVGIPRDRLTKSRRAALTALRLGAAALAILALFRPTLVRTETRQRPATLVVLVDASRSMLVEDAFGSKTRWQALVDALKDAVPALADLGEQNVEIKVYTFDTELAPVDFTGGQLALPEKPEGQQTALGAVLEDVLRREGNKTLLGVVLLSDGAQRAYAPRDLAPQTPARRMADLGTPLYAFSFGQARGLGQARDVAVKELIVNPTVFVKNELGVGATVRIDGLSGQSVPLQLLFETPAGQMEVVSTKELRAGQDGASLPVEMSYVPQTPGEYKLTLRAEKEPGEIVTTNNELSTFVTVLKGGLRVLYLEGSARVEQKFLRRSLDASADMKVDFVRMERDPKQRAVDLVPLFQRGKYDVYILGDVDSDAFHPNELTALTKVVEQGAGLIMLGGFHTFGPGGYYATPLADVLPIEMRGKIERQRYGDPIPNDLHLKGPLKMVPSRRAGAKHFVLQLAAGAANRAAWERLPPLEGANDWTRSKIKPSAQVLAETPDGKPLLVAAEAGGRVMALAVDSTWRWWMQGQEEQHKRFWRQVVLWLSHKDEQTEGNVWIKLAQRRYAPGGRVEFSAGAQTAHGEIVGDADYQAEAVLPDGTRRTIPLTRDGDTTTGIFADTQQAGDYTLVVTARHAGEELGTAKARFLIFEQDLELDNAAADPTLLDSLAKMSEGAGGRVLAPEELTSLIEEIKQRPLEMLEEHKVQYTPWDTWPFLLLFVGLLSTDWYLRKKWGLV